MGEGIFSWGVVLKAAPDRDLYVRWSTICDSPVWAGTRAEAIALGCDPQRLDRADQTGTSSRIGEYAWGCVPLVVDQRGLIARDRVGEYSLADLGLRQRDAEAMLDPFDDEGGN